MQDYGTQFVEKFPARITKKFIATSIFREVTNQEYEGEIENSASKLNIFSMGDVPLRTYSDAPMTNPDKIQESIGELVTDQKKSWYFEVQDIKKFLSQVKDPESEQMRNLTNRLKIEVDSYILSQYTDVAAGNRIGSDYTTGTVAVAVDGTVTGTGTTFTAAMVGRGFKAAGHSQWYRVKTYTSPTEIVIELDLDDETATYDGGAVSAGASYTVEAATPVAITKATAYDYLVDLGTKLTKKHVPKEGRWAVLPSEFTGLLLKNDMVAAPIAGVHDAVVGRGYIGRVAGFNILESEEVAGDNVNGFHILAGSKAWNTFALGFAKTGMEDVAGDFSTAYKGLQVYGSKVVDQNRGYAAELFCTVA